MLESKMYARLLKGLSIEDIEGKKAILPLFYAATGEVIKKIKETVFFVLHDFLFSKQEKWRTSI